MTNENEDIVNAGAENNDGEKKESHHSLLDSIIEKIEDTVDNLDNDFPLSGGIEHVVHHKHEDAEEETTEEKPEHKKSFLEGLDTEFPLSGGEV